MFYADVVKGTNSVISTLGMSKNDWVGSQVSNKTAVRTCVPKTLVKALQHSKPLMKPSDVHSTLTFTRPVKGGRSKNTNYIDCADIRLHNTFEVLNSNQVTDASDNSIISNIESHVTPHSEFSIKSVNYVNIGKQGKATNADSQYNGKHNTAERLTKNCQKYDNKNTGKNFSKEFVLKECEDKYDLELRFKPKYRQRISEAKHICMFKNWDNQMEDKYGFVPLGDILVPERNDKNPTIQNIKTLHQAVKNSKNFNFVESQIQVESQLNPDVWDKYLKDYWDEQLCYLIRYGFPLDHKQESPLNHDFKNHSTATLYEDDVKAYLQEEKQFGAILGPYSSCSLDNMHFSPF